MFTAIVRFRLRPELSLEEAVAEAKAGIPMWQAQPDLVRKQISLDVAAGAGVSVYLWKDKAAAERFFEMARPILTRQTGGEPDIRILETQIVVDNESGEVIVAP